MLTGYLGRAGHVAVTTIQNFRGCAGATGYEGTAQRCRNTAISCNSHSLIHIEGKKSEKRRWENEQKCQQGSSWVLYSCMRREARCRVQSIGQTQVTVTERRVKRAAELVPSTWRRSHSQGRKQQDCWVDAAQGPWLAHRQ